MSTTTPYFNKTPIETLTRAFNFADAKPDGATLSSGTVAAKNLRTGSDSTSTVLDSGTASISGDLASYTLKAGQAVGEYHRITLAATFDDGTILEQDIDMVVVEEA